eukprot:3469121-Lingulodinium_polyedra.AAC.1
MWQVHETRVGQRSQGHRLPRAPDSRRKAKLPWKREEHSRSACQSTRCSGSDQGGGYGPSP